MVYISPSRVIFNRARCAGGMGSQRELTNHFFNKDRDIRPNVFGIPPSPPRVQANIFIIFNVDKGSQIRLQTLQEATFPGKQKESISQVHLYIITHSGGSAGDGQQELILYFSSILFLYFHYFKLFFVFSFIKLFLIIIYLFLINIF